MGIMKIYVGITELHTSKRVYKPSALTLFCICHINLNMFLCSVQNIHSFSDDFRNINDLTFQK